MNYSIQRSEANFRPFGKCLKPYRTVPNLFEHFPHLVGSASGSVILSSGLVVDRKSSTNFQFPHQFGTLKYGLMGAAFSVNNGPAPQFFKFPTTPPCSQEQNVPHLRGQSRWTATFQRTTLPLHLRQLHLHRHSLQFPIVPTQV
jgi:hypothetical protein